MSRTIKQATLCQPACRMVVVEVWAAGGIKYAFSPVIAIEHLLEEYDEGDRDTRFRAVFVSGVDLVTLDEIERESTNSLCELAAAPWPEAEDPKRLADVVLRLTRKLAELLATGRKRDMGELP